MDSAVRQIAQTYLMVFKNKNNCNTGNVYEIYTAFWFLRKMGLTDADIDSLSDIIKYLEDLGKGNARISKVIEHIKKISVSSNLEMGGKKVVNLKNLTQEDGVGTADIALILDDGSQLGFSVTEGSGKIGRSGISKVITNAGTERMGCAEDYDAICALEKILTQADKDKFCEEKFGTSDKSMWNKRCKFPAAIKVQSDCAALIAARMTSLPDARRREIMNDLLCITKMPADYIVFVNKKTFTNTFYKISGTVIDKDCWIPKIKVNGVFLETYCGDVLVSKSQVKYNNGVGTSMRKVNIDAILDKLFKIERVELSVFKSS